MNEHPQSQLVAYDIPIKDILSDEKFNCRGKIVPIDVIELAKSIDQNGLQQPIVVQPFQSNHYKYRIVSGHRRHAAYIILEKDSIPCIIKAGLTDHEARKLNLEENLKRRDLNILQEARAIEHFKNEGMTQEDVSRELGMSRGWTQARFNLLDLPPEIQEEAAAGFLTQEHIKELYSMPVAQQFEAVKRIKEKRFAGDKRAIKISEPKKPNPLLKKPRDRNRIFEMQDLIRETLNKNNFGTRCLAWAAGEINDIELYQDLKELAEQDGIRWEIPGDILAQVNL